MPQMIRLGDVTNHGGVVLEGFPFYLAEGKPVSGLGHKVACPLCKGVFPIVEGNSTHTMSGVPLAYAGMKTACGAALISTQPTVEHHKQVDTTPPVCVALGAPAHSPARRSNPCTGRRSAVRTDYRPPFVAYAVDPPVVPRHARERNPVRRTMVSRDGSATGRLPGAS